LPSLEIRKGFHLYTSDDNEIQSIVERSTSGELKNEKGYIEDNLVNYNFEGIKYYAFESEPENLETVPVYRMLNSQSGAHLFTVDQNEINYIQENLPNFSTEGNSGVAFYVFELGQETM
jgi:hypothetical protein